MSLLFVGFVFFLRTISCQQNPSISFIDHEKVVNIGDTVDLHCSVQYSHGYPVIWAKTDRENPSNSLFISRGSSLVIPDNRYSIRHDEASSTFTLQLSKIQEVDAGIYQCQVVIGATSKVTADVRVQVNIPPIISDNSTRSVITSSGASVVLQCYANGHPIPQVSWRRENNDLLPTGGAVYRGNILTINNITKNDRGTYYCIADNGVGRGARRHVGVEVEFPPQVKAGRELYMQALQYDADIQCHIEAFPSPSILWLKDGYQLNDNQHYQISVFSTAHEFTDTILRIRRIEKKNYGKYICKAINKLGSHQMEIDLYESTNPICPPACGSSYNTAAVFVPELVQVIMTMLPLALYSVISRI